MRLPTADLAAIEHAVVRGWPALETQPIGGWLARWSSGGSVRANSVATLAFDRSLDLDEALAGVIAFYARHGGTPKINITGTSAPTDLDALLDARGWEKVGAHVTMAKAIGPDISPPQANVSVERQSSPSEAWFSVYLQGLSADRAPVARRLVDGVPQPRVFVSAIRGTATIASGLTVIDGALASVQCMATLAAARRTGAATALLSEIEKKARARGASRLYLQTDAENVAAINLYTRFGFSIVDRYHTRMRKL